MVAQYETYRSAIMTLVHNGHEEVYYDDVYMRRLNPERVKAARDVEMKYFKRMKVYKKVWIQECYDKTGKPPIKTRWVDTNKTNDETYHSYRSRLVAK